MADHWQPAEDEDFPSTAGETLHVVQQASSGINSVPTVNVSHWTLTKRLSSFLGRDLISSFFSGN